MRARDMGLDFSLDFSRLSSRNSRAASNASPPSSPASFAFRANTPPAPLDFSRHPDTHLSTSNDARHKRKRSRSEEDQGPIRKKRRLRLTLITSRLSLPFAVPTTHIVDRGRSRIAVWAKQKALGRSLLRKAAILNRVQRRVETAISATPNMAAGRRGEIEMLRRKGIEMTRLAHLRGSLSTVNSTRPVSVPMDPMRSETAPAEAAVEVSKRSPTLGPVIEVRKDYTPSPPSPLRMSNYDALDLEDEDEGNGESQSHEGHNYFNFGAAAASPAGTEDTLFLSEYDRLDDLDLDFDSAASSSSPPPLSSTGEDDLFSETGSSLFEHLADTSDEGAAAVALFAQTPPPPPHQPTPSSASPNDRLAEILQEKERQRQMLFLGLPRNPY